MVMVIFLAKMNIGCAPDSVSWSILVILGHILSTGCWVKKSCSMGINLAHKNAIHAYHAGNLQANQQEDESESDLLASLHIKASDLLHG